MGSTSKHVPLGRGSANRVQQQRRGWAPRVTKTLNQRARIRSVQSFNNTPIEPGRDRSMMHSLHPDNLPDPNSESTTRPSEQHFRAVYDSGFKTWATLCNLARGNRTLPAHCLSPEGVFPGHPCFPQTEFIEYDEHHASITALSFWDSRVSTDCCDLPSFEQQVRIGVTAQEPISLSIPGSAQASVDYTSWFVSNDDYTPILVLAWSYILSARWAELMPTTCSLKYSQAHTAEDNTTNDKGSLLEDQELVYVDIEHAEQDEARWWAAVLSSGQGWQATMRLKDAAFISPWSVRLQSTLRLVLLLPPGGMRISALPPTSSMAYEYLSRFCTRHNIADQSHAALAAAILLPSLNDGRTFQLAAPKIGRSKPSREGRKDRAHGVSAHLENCPDRFLALSCNVRGIRAMLLSVFYESQIECNVVTPWLQGTLAAIDCLAENNPCIVARACMEKTPAVSYLWLGVAILGLQQHYLQDVRRGQIPIDLHSAAWSGTLQSFIQQSVSCPLDSRGWVERADECRLLYLSRSDRYTRTPICQWRPFGSTAVEDLDIEARLHVKCRGHKLQYQGLRWSGDDATISWRTNDSKPSIDHSGLYARDDGFCVCYKALNRENEVISENTTRSIFGWLRPDGRTRDEKEIFQHPWLDMPESDSEDEDESLTGSDVAVKNRSLVKLWLDSLDGEEQR